MIQPGLERITRLLKGIQFPWKSIHVAGTNGKGSICGYASALLTRRNIRNGRFMSPHLIDRWDCITVNDKPVSETEFLKVEKHFKQLNEKEDIGASEFELLTATAFELFNSKKVDVGVVEVGMGGKLDATNVLDNQVVSVISMIAREHQDFLGNTLEEIALHKSGILRPKTPYIVNPMNEWNVHNVIDRYAEEIGAGPRIFPDTEQLRRELFGTQDWRKFAGALRPFQRDNAVLAYLAFLRVLEELNQSTQKASKLLAGLKTKQIPGRFQHLQVPPVFGRGVSRKILVDGAHNENAAMALKDLVYNNLQIKHGPGYRKPPPDGWPVTWVLAMSDGKDASKFLGKLLRPGDNVITTSFGPVDGMPWVKPMDPRELLRIALETHDNITGLYMPTPGTMRALCAAKYLASSDPNPIIVLTGSLYLVGDFMRQNRAFAGQDDAFDMRTIDREERNRVNTFLGGNSRNSEQAYTNTVPPMEMETETSAAKERKKLEDEIVKLSQEMLLLEQEENKLARATLQDAARTPIPGFENKERAPKNQKLFDHVEQIRLRLLELSADTPTDTPADIPTDTSFDAPINTPTGTHEGEQSDVEKIPGEEVTPLIRTHFAADREYEPPTVRLYRLDHSRNYRDINVMKDEKPSVRHTRSGKNKPDVAAHGKKPVPVRKRS